MGRVLHAPPPDWHSHWLAEAYASGDPSSIVVSAVDTATGISAQLTSAAAANVLGSTGNRMAWWTWRLPDAYGRSPVAANNGGGAWEVKNLLQELGITLQSNTRALLGVIDGPDPTGGSVSGFGGGLAWPSGGNQRRPVCWTLSGGTFADHNPTSGNDSVRGVLEGGKRKGLSREFSVSGIKSVYPRMPIAA